MIENRPDFDPKLESLRGLAALAVVITHSLAALKVDGLPAWWLVPSAQHTLQTQTLVTISAIANAQAAIVLFFMLSGYVLTLSLTADPRPLSGSEVARFLVRRSFRLLPAMWVSVLVFAVAMHSIPWTDPAGQASAAFTSWFIGPSAPEIARNLLLVSFGANPVTWTMYVEMIGSLAVVPMIALTRRLPLAASIGVTLALCAAAYWAWPTLTLSYLFAFHFGTVLCWHRARLRIAIPVATLCAGFALCFAVHLAQISGGAQLLATGAGCAMILAAVVQHGCRAGSFMSALHHPALRFTGRVSYSLYLFQLPVIYVVAVAVLQLGPVAPGIVPHLGITCTVLVILLPVAWASYVTVERPAVALGRRLSAAGGPGFRQPTL